MFLSYVPASTTRCPFEKEKKIEVTSKQVFHSKKDDKCVIILKISKSRMFTLKSPKGLYCEKHSKLGSSLFLFWR